MTQWNNTVKFSRNTRKRIGYENTICMIITIVFDRMWNFDLESVNYQRDYLWLPSLVKILSSTKIFPTKLSNQLDQSSIILYGKSLVSILIGGQFFYEKLELSSVRFYGFPPPRTNLISRDERKSKDEIR